MAYGRLVRLSLFPSAVADAGLGLLVGFGAFPNDWRAALAPAAALCVYHGGMALNDWADAERDAVDNPSRPIPSGAISRAAALRLSLLLLAIGPLLALLVGPGPAVAYALTGALAAGYDLIGRGAWTGPLLLAGARVANVASAACLGAALSGRDLLQPPRGDRLGSIEFVLLLGVPLFFYGQYVFRVSRLALTEDDPRPGNHAVVRGHLLRALVPGGALAGAILSLLIGHSLLLTGLGLVVGLTLEIGSGLRLLERVPDAPSPEQHAAGVPVQPLVGGLLRRLLLFSAAACMACGLLAGWVMAGLILCGFPVAARLKRLFPPT